MYDALKCSEEEISESNISAMTTYNPQSSTLQDYEPKVILKNPQKMMEDILNSISVADTEVDSNRLDALSQQKTDFDLMMGDQPGATNEDSDKKVLLKLTDKKDIFPKKPKKKSEQLKLKDGEQMQGDAPAIESESTLITTTDRQRRDANSVETTSTNGELITSTELPTEATTFDDLSSSTLSSELPTTTEHITTTAIIEETTTKFIVQGHPLHMSQAIFKDPILPDVNNTHERIEIGESEDRFIPPMLLVKAKTSTTTTTEAFTKDEKTNDASTYHTLIIDTTDIFDKSSSVASIKEEFSSDNLINETQLTTEIPTSSESLISATVENNENPILLEKRNDPRLGLKAVTQSHPLATTQQHTTTQSSPIVTVLEDLTTTTDSSSSSISSIDESISYESSSMFPFTTEQILETTFIPVDTSDTPNPEGQTISSMMKIDDVKVEKLIALTISTTEANLEAHNNKSTTTMRNDINAYRQNEDASHEQEEVSQENRHQGNHYDENNFSNAENFQPYKPNRHRTIARQEHHHGPGFSIGKILG